MADTTTTPTIASEDGPDLNYQQAQAAVTRQNRREMATRLAELKRQADGARERARKAQERYERAVALMASDKPERPDWYEHPGALPRKQLLEAARLNTMGLHRIMERYRKTKATKTTTTRRKAK